MGEFKLSQLIANSRKKEATPSPKREKHTHSKALTSPNTAFTGKISKLKQAIDSERLKHSHLRSSSGDHTMLFHCRQIYTFGNDFACVVDGEKSFFIRILGSNTVSLLKNAAKIRAVNPVAIDAKHFIVTNFTYEQSE